MKHVSVLVLSAVASVATIHFGAQAAPLTHFYANGVAVNNIAVMQHSIMLNAFNNFDASPAVALMKHAEQPKPEPIESEPEFDPSDNYGKMPTYGEYGDDGTVFLSGHGRSGGDFFAPTSNWIYWQHNQDYAKFNKFSKIDSKSDIISLGFSAEPSKISGGFSEFGGFGGVIIAREDNDSMKLSETGEYLGLYHAYHKNGYNLQMAANFGALFNDADSEYIDYDFTNLWAGAALNASYDIVLDETSMIQPGVYAGYTWVHSNGYVSKSGDDIKSIDNFNAFEVSPSLRAITHIGGGFYGIMSARYVFNFTDGGNAKFTGTHLDDLELKDYCEYGLSFEKNIDRFNMSVSINRRDGGRTGWNGGLRLRYLF